MAGSASGQCSKDLSTPAEAIFIVEHLAFIPLEPGKEGVSAIELLENVKEFTGKEKPWTEEMKLSVTKNSVSLIDFEKEQLIKRYLLSHIYSAEDINDDPMFKSVLVIRTTAWQTPQKYAVDFFQCSKVPANVIALEIQKLLPTRKQNVVHSGVPEPQALINPQKNRREGSEAVINPPKKRSEGAEQIKDHPADLELQQNVVHPGVSEPQAVINPPKNRSEGAEQIKDHPADLELQQIKDHPADLELQQNVVHPGVSEPQAVINPPKNRSEGAEQIKDHPADLELQQIKDHPADLELQQNVVHPGVSEPQAVINPPKNRSEGAEQIKDHPADLELQAILNRRRIKSEGDQNNNADTKETIQDVEVKAVINPPKNGSEGAEQIMDNPADSQLRAILNRRKIKSESDEAVINPPKNGSEGAEQIMDNPADSELGAILNRRKTKSERDEIGEQAQSINKIIKTTQSERKDTFIVQKKITKWCSLVNIRNSNGKHAENQELPRETLDEFRKNASAAPRVAPKPRRHSAAAAVLSPPPAAVTSTPVLNPSEEIVEDQHREQQHEEKLLKNKRLTAEEKILVGKVQKTEQQLELELEKKTVETHQFETNRLPESEDMVITERTGRSSHETSSLQSDLRNKGTASQNLNTEFQQKDEEDSKIQAEETLASTRKENQIGVQRSNEEHGNLSQQPQQHESDLCQTQKMVRGLRNQLVECKECKETSNIEKKRSSQQTSLQSDLQKINTRLQELENAVQLKDARLEAEKCTKTQSVETLASIRREYDERLQRSNEKCASLGEQLQQRESLFRQAQETIDGLRYQMAENEKTLNTERIRSLQEITSLQSNLQNNSERSLRLLEEGRQKDYTLQAEKDSNAQLQEILASTKKECGERLERSNEDGARFRQQYEESQSELRQAQETIHGLRNQLAESEKMVSTERTTSLEITTSLQSDLQEISERLKERDEMLERSNEEREILRQQYEESQSELHRAKETIIESRRDWTIPRDEIEISEKVLGEGGWGWVKEGKFRGTKVAVKQMHEIIISSYNTKLFQREMKMAASCRHPNLLQFLGATNDNGIALFVTELMDTNLRTELTQRSLMHKEVITLSLDVNLALNYLHLRDPPIVHRDISSANVLLWKQGNEWRAKLSDYGSVNLMQECKTACPGASIYAAPEARTSTQQSPKMDVYSYGVLLCEMCISQLPVPECFDEQISSMTDKDLRNLVRQCTNKEPEDRPIMQEAVFTLQGLIKPSGRSETAKKRGLK